MAALILALVALLPALAQAQVATNLAGGATSVRDLMTKSNGLYAACTIANDYDASGSGAGIDNFISGKYAIGVSDAPMSSIDEAKVNGNGKATIPLVLSRYSFYVNTLKSTGALVPKVKLSALTSLLIYRGKFATWAKVSPLYKGISNQVITRFARGEATGSGTTQIIKVFWFKGAAKFYPTATAPITNGDVLPIADFPGRVLRNGTGAMCTAVYQTIGGICYAQVGICDSLAGTVPGGATRINEALLLNKGGKYLIASTADVAASAPRQIPAYTDSWSSIPDRMVLVTGPKTNPISSFIYTFIRLRNAAAGGAKALAAKGALTCWLQKQATVASALYFVPLPGPIQVSALAFVKTVA